MQKERVLPVWQMVNRAGSHRLGLIVLDTDRRGRHCGAKATGSSVVDTASNPSGHGHRRLNRPAEQRAGLPVSLS